MTDLWLTLPCTKCIKEKGLSADQAGRRARRGTYYCQPCINEYQRNRNQNISVINSINRGDFHELKGSMDALKSIVFGDKIDVQELRLTFAHVYTVFSGVYRQLRDAEEAIVEKQDRRTKPPIAPDKSRVVNITDDVDSQEVVLQRLRLDIKWRRYNPTECEPRIKDDRWTLFVVYKYEGPEMDDETCGYMEQPLPEDGN